MRWLVLLLLLVPMVPAQGGVLDVQITEFAFDVGPETWKNRAPTQEAAADDLDLWSASLGMTLDVVLEVKRGGQPTDAAWTYEVTVSDGAVAVLGHVEVNGEGSLSARFDVDGQRAHAGQAAVPALGHGDWTIQVRASQESRHEGTGSTILQTSHLEVQQVGEPAMAGIAIPEGLLPHVREIGPGPNTWMAMDGVTQPFPVFLDAPEEAEIQWDVWIAYPGLAAGPATIPLPVPDLPDPLFATPLGGNDPTDAATVWYHQPVTDNNQYTGDGWISGLPVTAEPTLIIYTAHTARGGMVALVAPAQGAHYSFQEILATPGTEGPVSVVASGPIDIPVASLHVLAQDQPGTPGAARGARHLTTGILAPAGENVWRGGYDGATTRASGEPVVAIIAFFSGQDGQYAGHLAGLRGIAATLQADTLGQGYEGAIQLGLAHPQPGRDAALSIPVQVHMAFAGTDLGTAEVELAAGGTLTRSYAVTPEDDGAQPAEAILDTGDLRFAVHKTFPVLDDEAYADATAPWYDVPGLGLPLLMVGLAFLVPRTRRLRED